MMRSISQIGSMAAALVVLLLVFTIGAQAAVTPDCPVTATSVRTKTFTGDGATITVSEPGNTLFADQRDRGRALCPATGCNEKVTITGLPTGWLVEAYVDARWVYTGSGMPDQTFYTAQYLMGHTPGPLTGDPIVIRIPLPDAHSWPTFEIHVNVNLYIFKPDGVGGYTLAAISDSAGFQGLIGPEFGGWDPACRSLGCTPGYWKNHVTAWWPDTLPNAIFAEIMGIPSNKINSLNNVTMLQASAMTAGGERAMIRHCAAAYAGSSWVAHFVPNQGACMNYAPGNPDATLSMTQIATIVQTAYSTGDFATAQAACAAANGATMCPLSDVWLGTDGTGLSCNPLVQSPSATPFKKVD